MSRPLVTIVEQPAAKLQRFRYLSEVDGARSVGSIPGVRSTPDRKTYPTIRVHGYEGPFLVLLSLINPDNDLVHPHVITGSDPRYQCRQGVIYLITNEPEVVFRNIGILCVKGKTESDVTASLKNRKRMNVDPFGVGFRHINDHRLIDFTAVRLCFQVFLPGPDWTPKDLNDPQKYNKPLPPVRSNVVYDAKKVNDLKITYIHNCAGPRTGDHEMTLLCEKYTGQNPEVVFEDGHGWEQTAFVKIYHKQLAIVFHTPPYRKDVDPNCKEYKVKVYLRQTTDRGIECSQPTEMFYLGNDDKGDPIQSPMTILPKKPRLSLKQVRIQQRSSPGNTSPEHHQPERWRPWGRSEPLPKEDHIPIQKNKPKKYVSTLDVHEKSDAIPPFDPEKSELYAHEWINIIDQHGDTYNWTDTMKSYYMQTKLSGIAKVWLTSLTDIDNMTWPAWKKKLLEAFPRKVDYVELIEKMLAQEKIVSEMAQYYNHKHDFRARHEENTKKAYARLIEGEPLFPWSEHHLDRTNEPPQRLTQRTLIERPNVHIADDRFEEDKKDINLEDNYIMYTNDPENDRHSDRLNCCCKEKPPIPKHYWTHKLNEIRPSCIQRNLRSVEEKTWHKPCSTITSSSSSLSSGNLASDCSIDQSHRVESVSGTPNYKSLLPKMNPRANYKPKIKRSDPVATPSTPIQPFSPSQSFKMSPPYYQEPSPLGENAELVYTQPNYQDAFSNIPSNSQQPINEIIQGNLNIHNIPNHKVTTTDTIPVYPQNPLHVMGNSQHSLAIQPDTKTKRTKPKPNSGTFDSSELLPKREKVDPDFESPRYRPSTSFTSYNPFNSVARSTSIDYLQTDRENNTNLNIENVFDCIWANTNSGELKEALQSMAEAESWGAGIPTLINTISMSGQNNVSNTRHNDQIGMAHNFHNGNQSGMNGDQNVHPNVIQPGLPFGDQNVLPNVPQNGISHGDENVLNIQDYYQATQADDSIPSEELKRMILG